jgi:hypothetical protein
MVVAPVNVKANFLPSCGIVALVNYVPDQGKGDFYEGF